MTKCERCYHNKVCINGANHKNAESCNHFKDKSLIAELPCKAGDILYVIDYDCDTEMSHIEKVKCNSIEIYNEDDISIYCETIESHYDTYTPDDFGEIIFRTKTEAEAALKEYKI